MKRLTRGRAIRAKCLDCCAGSAPEVRRCDLKQCALWRFRLGKEIDDQNPSGTRKAEKQAVAHEIGGKNGNEQQTDRLIRSTSAGIHRNTRLLPHERAGRATAV